MTRRWRRRYCSATTRERRRALVEAKSEERSGNSEGGDKSGVKSGALEAAESEAKYTNSITGPAGSRKIYKAMGHSPRSLQDDIIEEENTKKRTDSGTWPGPEATRLEADSHLFFDEFAPNPNLEELRQRPLCTEIFAYGGIDGVPRR
ncbi:hypothetical protein C8R44DRAFT_750462 [Mycena epipterygia]|nr:hypothetical protein C8R44DRAFT_750462 [Mycena epipterygia]